MNLSAVNLNLMVALDALLDERSVTKAARRVGVTQPAMSYSLRQLRELFGDPLLERGLLTPLAESLRDRVRSGLSELQHVLDAREDFEPTASERTFRIAASDTFQVVGLHRFLALVASRAPGVDIVLRPPDHATHDALAAGSIDLLAGSHEQASRGLSSTPLYEERFVCIVRSGHPEVRSRLGLATYCRLPHALVAIDEAPGYVDRALAQLDRSRRVALRLPDFAGIGHVIAGTDMVATVPGRLAERLAETLPLRVLTPPVRFPTFPVSLYWHGRFDAEPGHRWLRDQLVESSAASG